MTRRADSVRRPSAAAVALVVPLATLGSLMGCSDDETTPTPTTTTAGGGTGGSPTGSAGGGGTTAAGGSGGARCVVEDLSFDHQVVDDSGPSDVWQKIVGDMNGDGRIDLLAGGRSSGGLVWYENPDWTRHEIAPGGDHSTDGEVADVNGDGDADVVSLTTSRLLWYESPDWTSHEIEARGLHDVELADFDGDGDVDAVARDQGEFGHSGAALHFYAQQSPTSWTHREVTIVDGEGLLVADVDGDTDADVIIAERWYENTGDILGGPWTEHRYTSSFGHDNAFVAAADVNGDGRLDVVLSPSELAGETARLAWYEAPSDPTAGDWTEHIIEDGTEAVHHFVGAADFDGDGDIDVTSAEMQQGEDPDEVEVLLNDGAGQTWTQVLVSSGGSHSMRVVDVNADGYPDLFGANFQSQQVDLWINVGCTP